MRALTNNECRRWVKAQGLIYQPFRQGIPVTGQFGIEDAKDGGEGAQRAMLNVCRQASQALVVIEDHPLTYAERRAQLADFRATHGEIRSLENAPGHLLSRKDDLHLSALLRLCIGPGSWWSTCVYLAPISTTMLVWESSLVDLWTKRQAICRLLKDELPETKTA